MARGAELSEPGPRLHLALLASLGAALFALHMALARGYGYFRDELYFLDCGRHLDWGYVDHAPLIGLVARMALALGGSVFALRVFPALASGVLVVLAGLLAHRMGGGRFAQALAALAVIVTPVYLGGDSVLSMNAFEPLFWMACVFLLLRIFEGGSPRLWLAFGAVLGAGLMNKHSTVFFGVAVVCGLLLTRERRQLLTPWPWLGALVALVVFAPNLVWQIRHDFATLEDLRNVSRTGKNVVLGPVQFLAQQILLLHPALFPLWLGGLVFLFRARAGRFRPLAWTYVVFYLVLLAMKAKNYYLAPIYPMLFAAGAVALEAGLERWPPTTGRAWSRVAVLAYVVVMGAVLAPIALPLFSPEGYVAYASAIGVTPPKTEVAQHGPLPQLFGDQFGWPELAAEVARIYNALPPEERAKAAIFANNYGEAGAIDMFGPALGLPAAISGHQTHFLWGPRGYRGEVLIVIQDDRESLEKVCASVEEAGTHFHPWGMMEENNAIFVCRGLHPPLPELWPRLKHWN